MADDHRLQRGDPQFWEKLGLDRDAAKSAAWCFPEGRLTAGPIHTGNEKLAYRHLTEAGEYATEAWHPAFWYAQGYDFDEMARRAVTVNVMLNLGEMANAQPQGPDSMADALLAPMSQSRPQLPPPRYEDYVDYEPPLVEQHSEQPNRSPDTPFNSDAFPRLDP